MDTLTKLVSSHDMMWTKKSVSATSGYDWTCWTQADLNSFQQCAGSPSYLVKKLILSGKKTNPIW